MDVVTKKLEQITIRFDGTFFFVTNLLPQTDLKSAREISAALNQIANGKKYPVLMDSRSGRNNPTEEANNYFRTEEYCRSIAYMTVVLAGKWVVHGARIYSSFINLPIEVKYYTTELEAFAEIARLNPECLNSPLKPVEQIKSNYSIKIDLYTKTAEVDLSGDFLNATKLIHSIGLELNDIGPTHGFSPYLVIKPFKPTLFAIIEVLKLARMDVAAIALISTVKVLTPILNAIFSMNGLAAKIKVFNNSSHATIWAFALSNSQATNSKNLKTGASFSFEQTTVISDTLERFSRGDYSPVDTQKFQSNTQLAIFGNLINLMAGKIRQQLDDLESANKLLEQRVLERTQELDDQRNRTVEQARLAAVGRFASSLAHEVNNPLAVISGTSNLIQKKLEHGLLQPDELKDKLQTIDKMLERAANIVKAVRNLSRDSADGPLYIESLNEIVKETLFMVESSMRELNIKVHLESNGDIAVPCRRTEIGQVVINLINNARDAVESTSKEQRWIRIELLDTAQSAAIKISNGGPLIPKEIQEKMMEPFFTTKPVGKGTGLGLSLSHSIMKQHGGKLVLNPGEFTCFQVELPKNANSELKS